MTVEVEALATTAELAEFLRVDSQTVKSWRRRNRGPRWISIEGSVRYRWSDVEDWVRLNTAAPEGDSRADRA